MAIVINHFNKSKGYGMQHIIPGALHYCCCKRPLNISCDTEPHLTRTESLRQQSITRFFLLSRCLDPARICDL